VTAERPRSGYRAVLTRCRSLASHVSPNVCLPGVSSDETKVEKQVEHRLLEYDTTVPVSRRVACSCGWEATYGAGKTALGAWHDHLAEHGAA
jgi:hypothetical protein